jgi:hypothetical protein
VAVYETRKLGDGTYCPEPPKAPQNGPQGPEKESNDGQ